MFAVVYFGGKQYKLREKEELEVEKLDIEDGKNFKIEEVLLLAEEDGSMVKIGMPYVAGAHVECQVLGQGKGDKIRVFKFKAKKRYHKTQGHRQKFTSIKVLKISAVEKKASAKEDSVDDNVVEKTVEKAPKAEKAVKTVATKKVAVKKTAKKA
ncbi:MAG: 50S ribosomal protein L21 [Candidatus Gracilibacteria bacterium]